MKSKKLRTFFVNEKEMIFNVRLFQELFNKYAKKNSIGVGAYEDELADVLFVDKSAVHNWRMNVNGPGNIEIIQKIAEFWNINYEILLTEANNMNETQIINAKKFTETEKEAMKNVYRAFINYMEEFNDTAGFLLYIDGGKYEIANAYARYENLKYALKLEYIDLKRTVYDKLETFFEGELTRTLEHDYEVDDSIEQLEAETLEEYENMMSMFKNIVDEYLMD